MEPFLADLIKNKKIPKIIRYLIVILLCGFITFIGIGCGLHSIMIIGKIFGFILAGIFFVTGICLILKIHND